MKTFFTGIVAVFLFHQYSIAQNTGSITSDTIKPTKTTATIFAGVAYVPNLHYYGRTDSLKSSALIPTVLVQFDSSGFYISGSAVFIDNPAQSLQYGATVTEAGYKFGKKKGIAGSIYANKFFYQTKELVQSALKEQAGLNISYLNKFVNINSTAVAAFSGNTDFFASAGLDHAFKFTAGKSVFVITPTAVASAGTQNFTHTYYKKNNFLLLPVADQQVTASSRVFNILSYECSMPIVWAIKNCFIVATPGYVMPQHIITVAGRPDISERARNLFYTNITLLYALKIKK
jgi:hypothetical protein